MMASASCAALLLVAPVPGGGGRLGKQDAPLAERIEILTNFQREMKKCNVLCVNSETFLQRATLYLRREVPQVPLV